MTTLDSQITNVATQCFIQLRREVELEKLLERRVIDKAHREKEATNRERVRLLEEREEELRLEREAEEKRETKRQLQHVAKHQEDLGQQSGGSCLANVIDSQPKDIKALDSYVRKNFINYNASARFLNAAQDCSCRHFTDFERIVWHDWEN